VAVVAVVIRYISEQVDVEVARSGGGAEVSEEPVPVDDGGAAEKA